MYYKPMHPLFRADVREIAHGLIIHVLYILYVYWVGS